MAHRNMSHFLYQIQLNYFAAGAVGAGAAGALELKQSLCNFHLPSSFFQRTRYFAFSTTVPSLIFSVNVPCSVRVFSSPQTSYVVNLIPVIPALIMPDIRDSIAFLPSTAALFGFKIVASIV